MPKSLPMVACVAFAVITMAAGAHFLNSWWASLVGYIVAWVQPIIYIRLTRSQRS